MKYSQTHVQIQETGSHYSHARESNSEPPVVEEQSTFINS